MTSTETILYAIGISCAGGLIIGLFSRHKVLAGWINFLITATSGTLALYGAAIALMHGPIPATTIYSLPQYGSALRIYVDGLSAIFLGLIATIAILSSLYAIRYMDHYHDYGVGRFYPYFQFFIGGMYGIVATTDLMVFFCLFWQMMTLPSYTLIRYESKQRENVRAANKYLLMMEISCALVMLGSYWLAGNAPVTGDGATLMRFDFDAIRQHASALGAISTGSGTFALLLFLVGFGIKAGMWPFGQMWLPDAHPAAPSPVSALLSGVMIKTGIYGLMRSFIWLMPSQGNDWYSPAHWGVSLAILGTVTLFFGTLQALKQEQSKRLLAFHSIGQIGYILLGLGACLTLLPVGKVNTDLIALSAIGFYGALFHTLNHGLFKSLLFLNAGSMLYATGTQDLNRLGGLMKYMLLTAFTALVASFSIAGVPLFNGFASKWSIYVATILGSRQVGYLAFCGIFGIVTSALTLASFMKFFGVSFLSRMSNLIKEKTAQKTSLEVEPSMQIPQVLLALFCILLGLLPGSAYHLIHLSLAASNQGLAEKLLGAAPAQIGLAISLPAGGHVALLAPLTVGVVMLIMFLIAGFISKLGAAERRTADIWLCGYVREADTYRYSAHNLYTEVKRYFHWIGGMPRHFRAGSPEMKGKKSIFGNF
jgi:formate hydrogenlyase subunit 3/multisubunit Na+/H+ antiporter MnhD subunit